MGRDKALLPWPPPISGQSDFQRDISLGSDSFAVAGHGDSSGRGWEQ